MGYPRSRRARAHKFARRTGASVTLVSAAWANVDAALDLTLDAQAGDDVEVGVAGMWSNEAAYGVLDVVTLVSAAPVNALSTGAAEGASAGDGNPGWYGPPSAYSAISGSMLYTLVAGDIASGVVTLRLRGRVASGSSKSVLTGATDPLQFWAKNLGPADPN